MTLTSVCLGPLSVSSYLDTDFWLTCPCVPPRISPPYCFPKVFGGMKTDSDLTEGFGQNWEQSLYLLCLVLSHLLSLNFPGSALLALYPLLWLLLWFCFVILSPTYAICRLSCGLVLPSEVLSEMSAQGIDMGWWPWQWCIECFVLSGLWGLSQDTGAGTREWGSRLQLQRWNWKARRYRRLIVMG